jgi:hypothetical protein
MSVSKLSRQSIQAGFPKQQTIWDQVTNAPAGMEPISGVTLSASQSSISFSGIPQTYTHLQIRGIARSTYSGQYASVSLQFNGDSAANYSNHGLYGDGSTTSAFNQTGSVAATALWSFPTTSTTSGNNMFGCVVYDILDYTSVNKTKVVKMLSGYDANGSGQIHFHSGMWLTYNSAINQINVITDTGFAQYTSFALYGVK